MQLDGCNVTSSTVKNLGVILESNLSFENHISHVTKTAFFHLRNISKLRNMLSVSDAEKLVHAFMTSRLDYCNALLGGCPASSINSSRKPTHILRDTGGSQSFFILSNTLDFCENSACDTSTIVQGIEMGFVTVPHHRVWVTSELASECFEVAVRPSLPVKGIDFIMDNDIAGCKVMPAVQVINAPCVEVQSDLLAKTLPGVFK